MNTSSQKFLCLAAAVVVALSCHAAPNETVFKSSELIGTKIENQSGENLGRVEDLAIELTSGKLLHVIMGSGGVVSLGERYIAIPPDSFNFERANKLLRIDLSKEQLKAAPTLELSQWDSFYDSDRADESTRFFAKNRTANSTVSNLSQLARNDDNSGKRNVVRASKAVGITVKNAQDEKVGSTEDLVVDLASRRITAVILSTGGFLGMGNSFTAVPPQKIMLLPDEKLARMDVTKESLKNAPHFGPREHPDFSSAEYAQNLNSSFGIVTEEHMVPDHTAMAEADNTARNTRDREFKTLTPVDQGNNSRDLEITKQIRKAVVDTEGLSVNAQNVKIITVDGKTTLRGPVNSKAEQQKIHEIAAKFAHRVDDQIEVATQDTSQK
ncbi:MAG: PRC-barrel domain-containing protein [Nibricoccus sp.]